MPARPSDSDLRAWIKSIMGQDQRHRLRVYSIEELASEAMVVDTILEAVATAFEIPRERLYSRRRSRRRNVMPRWAAMFLLTEYTRASHADIARMFHQNGKSISHAMNRMTDMVDRRDGSADEAWMVERLHAARQSVDASLQQSKRPAKETSTP